MIAAGVELFKQMRVGLSNASVVERIYRAMRAARGYLYFDPQMRSPSAEACGKRLERSKKRLKQKQSSIILHLLRPRDLIMLQRSMASCEIGPHCPSYSDNPISSS